MVEEKVYRPTTRSTPLVNDAERQAYERKRTVAHRRTEMGVSICHGTIFAVFAGLCITLIYYFMLWVDSELDATFPPSVTKRNLRDAAGNYQFTVPSCIVSDFHSGRTADESKEYEGIDLSEWGRTFCGEHSTLTLYCVRREGEDNSHEAKRCRGINDIFSSMADNITRIAHNMFGRNTTKVTEQAPENRVTALDAHNKSNETRVKWVGSDEYYEYIDGERVHI